LPLPPEKYVSIKNIYLKKKRNINYSWNNIDRPARPQAPFRKVGDGMVFFKNIL